MMMMMMKFFAAEMFIEATGMKITHVTYEGNTPAVTAVVSGEVNYEGLTGSDAARRLAELSNRYGKVVRATGIKAE
jgi:hypothetical protein